MKGKQLRKAVLLGMAMSMAVWTTGMAATTVGPITETYNENNKTALGNVTVENGAESASIQIGHENTQDVIVNIKTEANGAENGDILLKSGQYGIRTENESTGTIQLDAGGNNTISFADGSGISADSGVRIELRATGDNFITFEGSSTDHDGINAGSNNTGGIALQGTNNIIKVQGNDSDGIYTDTGSKNQTDLIAEGGSNTITAGNNGIDHRGSGNVKLQANNGSNKISANVGDGIRIQGDGTATVTGQTNKIEVIDDGLYIHKDSGDTADITLTATGSDAEGIGNHIDGNNGIHTAGENRGNITVTANGGKNVIHGTQNAVYNSGSGTINIIASGNSTGEGISLLADYIKYDNFLTAGENGVKSDGTGETNVIADNDNIIAGTTNGILSNDSGTINVTAGNDNFIGQYADESGRTVTSQNGINVTAGTVNVTGNANKIYALGTGILLSGTESPGAVNLYGTTNEISVGSTDSTEDVAGIYFSNTSDKVVNIQGGIGEDNTPLYSDNISVNVSSAGDAMGLKFDGANNNTVNLYADEISINASSDGGRGNGIWVQSTASGNTINLNAAGDVYLSADMSKQSGSGAAVWLTGKDNTLSITGGNNTITTENSTVRMEGLYISGLNSNISLTATAEGGNNTVTSQSVALDVGFADTISLDAQHGSNRITSLNSNGISIANVNEVKLTASDQNNIQASSDGISFTTVISSGKVTLNAKDNIITAGGDGIYLIQGTTGSVDMIAHGGNNEITADKNHGIAVNSSYVSLIADQGKNIIKSNNPYTKWDSAIYAVNEGSKVTLTALQNEVYGKKYGINSGANKQGGIVTLTANAGNNEVTSEEQSIYSVGNSNVSLKAVKGDNKVNAGWTGIYSTREGNTSLQAGRNNEVRAGQITEVLTLQDGSIIGYGDQYAFETLHGSTVTLEAGNINTISGLVYAGDADTLVEIKGLEEAMADNYVFSSAVVVGAGDLDDSDDEVMKNKNVVSALYAEEGAVIRVAGENNFIQSYADNKDETTLERTVWAYDRADITIDGTTTISTDRYETSPNSLDIAIAAGTAVKLDSTQVNTPVADADRAKVTLNYGAGSSITGDVLSAYKGQVNINPIDGSHAGIVIKGNILAGNNGVLNVNLGNGGTLTGRADDYGDAGVIDNSGHGTEFFNPAFSSDIFKGGEVNLTMGDNSRWNVTGQSWITRINTNGENALINLVNSDTDRNENAHALTVYEMNGDAIFNMSLNADRTLSDMVYMKNAEGEYIVNVVDPVTQADMYAGRNDGGIFDGLRFATVGKGSKASFRAITWDQGVNNIEYEVGTDSYDTSDENHHYDSSTGNGAGDTEKPGTDLVEGFFGSEGTPGVQEAPANGIMLMAARADEGMGTNTEANGTEVDETTNFKLIGVKNSEISDAGKTVVAMSRVNYANAVYMDRLNKRMGEARYIDGDEGLWVRMRHDRIGKSDAFRSMNTMMELGYDTRVNDREDGEHRQGVAIDYMRGTADYKNVAGEGDVRRGGIWFYDTWLGNKGHYTDYVLKFGRLSNDFELYTRTLGEKVTGDYSNFVYSASAEYGRKKDLGNNWYIEPQAQIQYAHVTDADYTTSQDTHVQLDAIDSLIGRVGFRLGKDVGEKSTFYIKADVLHEFLGDQDIEARDATGLLSTTYENEGTWYDIGLGFSHQFSKGTYMYLDMEKSIGNDNEDTYQFNFGMNWKV